MDHEFFYDPENSIPNSSSNDIGPHFKEYRPHSTSEYSTNLLLQSLAHHSVLKHYVLSRATVHWDGPKYVTYNTESSRLLYFIILDLPHLLDLTPNSLSEADFFFTGKFHTII